MTQQTHPLFKEWLHRLETEEHTRIDGYLSLEGKGGAQCFCALGVAADVLVEHGLGQWTQDDGGVRWFTVHGSRLSCASITQYPLEKLGLGDQDSVAFTDFVTILNDKISKGKYTHSWPEIADRIREYVNEESN